MMIIKKVAISLSVSIAIVGCAHQMELIDTVVDLNHSYRVIEHNFDSKYGLVYEPNQVDLPVFTGTEKEDTVIPVKTDDNNVKTIEDGNISYVDIDFYNESAVVKNREEVIEKIKNNITSNRYLIIGHSHGKSIIGVESLSTQRARYISNVLFVAGVPRKNMFFISSWSDGGQPYGIPKGARVIGLPENLNSNIALITGLQIEDKT